MKRSLGFLSFACFLSLAASQLKASPIAYTIQFTLISGSPAPISGSFDYDSSAPLDEAFSDFIVNWDGADYNLTVDANDPVIYGTPLSSCTPSNNSAGVFYALLNPSDCPAPPGGQTEWEGSPASSLNGDFEFVFGSQADALAIYSETGTSSEVPYAIGSYTVAEATSTPEPGSLSLIILAGLGLVGLAIRRTELAVASKSIIRP